MTSTQPQRAANQSTAKEANETPFSYDDVLEHIGHLGRYQIRTFLILLMPCFFFGLNILNYTFTAGIPQYRLVSHFCFKFRLFSYVSDVINQLYILCIFTLHIILHLT